MANSDQSGKYNISIGKIKGDPQFGDRTYYQGMNAAEIQEVVRSLMNDLQKTSQPDAPQSVKPKKILFLASCPKEQAKLELDKEVRNISDMLTQSRYREQFILERRWAVRPSDLQKEILQHGPEILHFSGHGEGEHGLVLETDVGTTQFVSTEALANLFALVSDTVKCVVLNACYSEVQAKAIQQHIDFVVGMNNSIGDRAAIVFASAFYMALGYGRSIEDAYQFGCNAIALQGIAGNMTPVLLKKP